MKKFYLPRHGTGLTLLRNLAHSSHKVALVACTLALIAFSSTALAETSPAEPATPAGEAEAADVAVPKNIPVADGVGEQVEGMADQEAGPEADAESASVDVPDSDDVRPAEENPDHDESWRITPSGQPPVQVRRAVDRIIESAQTVAEEKSRTAESSDEAQSDEAHSDEDVESASRILEGKKRVLRQAGQLDRLKDALDLDEIRRVAGTFLTAGGGDQLVLSAYVSDPRWIQAMQLLKDDDCEESLEIATELLGPPEVHEDGEPAIRYVLGRIQMCTKEHAAAGKKTLEALTKTEDGKPAQGAIATLARKRLGLPAGKDSDAKDEGLYLSQRIAKAKRLARSGKVDEAIKDLDTLDEEQSSWWNKYKIRSAEVDILEHAGDLKAATRKMLGIYRFARDWNIGDAVQAKLERLQKRAGVEVLSFGERVDRMRDLIARGDYRDAQAVSVENAKLRGVSGDEIRGWSFYRRALEEEKKRDRKQAAEMFEQAEKLVKDPAIRPRLYFGWARALRRLDRDPEAIALYDRICDEFPRHHLCDDALFEAGRLSQYLDRHQQARDNFSMVVGLFPDSEHVPDALWRGAFSAYLMEDYEAAQSPLEHIIAYYGDVQDASELTLGLKAQYWLGTAKLKAGDTDGAKTALQETINRGPLTWYGRLAASRMKEAGLTPHTMIPRSTLAATELNDLSTLRVPRHKRFEVAAELCRLGLYEDAIGELREQVSIHPVPDRAHEFLAAVYLADRQPNYAHWIMKKHIDETGPGYHNLRDWGVAFPVDYMELSHKYGEKFGVSPFLVQAIIRQESGFRAGVSSYAGALGLMQLMPGTARYTERQFMKGGGRLHRSHIVQPETNVRLGTMYIRIQTAFAADHIPLALAGYNAGPAPLESWFARYGERELDAWVESITYREARGYVRKVFTSYVTYAGLYGNGELPEISLQMPEELREWGDVPEVEKVEEGEPVSWVDIEGF
jgi:soluble lytic murein transglycosylase-like protein